MGTADMNWRKSSFSTGGATNCVEVGTSADAVLVRDTTDRDGGTLVIPADAWSAFIRTL